MSQISHFTRIHQVNAAMIDAERPKDMTKLTGNFHNYTNTPKN